ncbi:zinc finger CCHC domain-containing protein 2-like [Uloborus diversus]|uniref:zinc finger CCHC domain-containing protein 2-like n=1 Tax=Uloborus diversus TaxID=327109 RepID=UPI00240A96DE|nr:zinc finger CCHC domain-containing protein 2-like [Uloborus diversus]
MVCKEEVFMWFQNLKGSKRIEAMCGFFNMCYPLELRFYGTCLEDLGRRDFYTFRDEEVKANTLGEVLKIRDISESCVRSKLIVVLSLLNSSNLHCAKELFNILSEEIKIESLASSGVFSDPKIVEEYLLLLTIAQHHPAFTFAQQTFLSELSISLESYAKELNPRIKYEYNETCLSGHVFPCVGVLSSPSPPEREIFNNSFQSYRYATAFQRRSDMHQNPVRIRNLKVKPPHKKMNVRIRVLWGNGKNTDAFKTPHDLLVFHQKLIQQFPTEAKNISQEKCIPTLPHLIATWNKQSILNEGIISSVSEYIQQLNSRLPSYVLESDFVTTFFMPSTHNRPIFSRSNRNVDCQHELPPKNARLRSLTIYNSQMADSSPGHQHDTKPKNLQGPARRETENRSSVCSRVSPPTSPLQSPSSSPYTSPVNSETNSRCGSPWSHAAVPYSDRSTCTILPNTISVERSQPKDLIYDQWDSLRQCRIEELQAMPNEGLEALGILKDATLRKSLDRKSPPNGLLNNYIPKCVAVVKPGALTHVASNDSSPACSEYSSPPQSPSPAEVYNQSSSLSSSNEDSNDKRTSKSLAEVGKISETESNVHDSNFKRPEDDILLKSINRTSLSVLPFAAPYTTIVTPIPPPQNIKPAYLPVPCRTNSAPQHISPGTVVFDNQFSRVPLPSALTFLPGQPRAHTVTPDRILSSTNLPISTVSPFPVTSGSVTVPSASCSITTQKSSNVTAVTNSGASSRSNQKRDNDMGAKVVQQSSETPYATGYILSSTTQLTAVSCSCFTTNSARPSPAPSPSMSPGTTPQPSAVPVSLPYLGMPYVFHSIPFLQAQAPANGFVPQPGMANPGQGYSYALPNGITAIPPELMYPGQTFTLQSPSTQGSPGQVASPSQCYGAFPQTTAVPLKLITCYNCGKVGHRGTDCKEQTMDDINKTGRFQLNYNPVPKVIDSHE